MRQSKPTAESRYRDAYERGIRRAAPGVPFAIVGKVGSVLGPAAKVHALDGTGEPLAGDALLAWFEEAAYAFRIATADRGQFVGGWSVWHFARWLNERGGEPVTARAPLGTFRREGPGASARQPPGTYRPSGRDLQAPMGKRLK